MSAGKFEAIKYALRQNKDGTVVSFVVHPNDCSSELNNLPIGARVKIEWTECTDEEPASSNSAASSAMRSASFTRPAIGTAAPQSGEETAAPSHKERQHFSDMAPATQAALRCKDVRFQNWIIDSGEDPVSEELAAEAVRDLCHVKSRSALNTSIEGAFLWKELNLQYEAWLTQQDHAELVR